MHNHGHSSKNGSHDAKMMWLVMLACFVPIIFLAFIGGGAGRNSVWWLFGAGAVMLGLHTFIRRGHTSHRHEDNTGTDAAGNQPAVAAAATPADSSTQPPVVATSAMKSGHKHDCC